MAVKVECPSCEMLQTVKDEKIGARIRCKECDEPFVAKARKKAKPADDEDDDDLPRPKKKKKKAAASGGLPGWVIAVSLGGVVLIGVVVVVIMLLPGRNRGGVGEANVPGGNPPAMGGMPGMPGAATGPHAKIIDDVGQVVGRISNALNTINDEQSLRNATNSIRTEAQQFTQLVNQLQSAPQPSPADLQAFFQAEQRVTPTMKQFEQTARNVGGRLNNRGISPAAVQEFQSALSQIAGPAQTLESIERRYQMMANR